MEEFNSVVPYLVANFRIIGVDSRGQGKSTFGSNLNYARIQLDIETLLQSLQINDVTIIGFSDGGTIAYRLAIESSIKINKIVTIGALIIEDIGAVMSDDMSFVLPWAGIFETREALADRIGPRLVAHLQDSFRHTPAGWRVAFNPQDMLVSQGLLNGDHWQDWLATSCPALRIRGLHSPLTTQSHFDEMAARRPNTYLKTLEGGHVVHFDNPIGFTGAVRAFLQEL